MNVVGDRADERLANDIRAEAPGGGTTFVPVSG
jgi:hypothetical protein